MLNSILNTILDLYNGGVIMNVNTENFKKLVDANFEGSLVKCAKALNVDHSTIWRVANGNNNMGIKLLSNLMEYCNKNSLNYSDYIFLNTTLD